MAKITVTPKSAAQNKREIMQYLGFKTTTEYNRAYDVFRNRVRNFERATGAAKQSAAYLFHDYAYRKSRGLELTGKLQGVLYAPASTTSTKKPISAAAENRVRNAFLLEPFAGLIKKMPKERAERFLSAPTIAESVRLFTDYAADVRQRKKTATNAAIPFNRDFYE